MEKNKETNTSQLTITRKVVIALITVFALLIPSIAIYNVFYAPKPLGQELEFLGRSYSGTIPFLSDSNFSVAYFYGTDIARDGVEGYFKKATLQNREEITSNSVTPVFSFTVPGTSNPLYVNYHDDGAEYANGFNLKPTQKKHIIVIQAEDYQAAKDSL